MAFPTARASSLRRSTSSPPDIIRPRPSDPRSTDTSGMRLFARTALIALSALAASCSTARAPAPQASMRALPVMERVALGPMLAGSNPATPPSRSTALPRTQFLQRHTPHSGGAGAFARSRPLLVVQASGEQAKTERLRADDARRFRVWPHQCRCAALGARRPGLLTCFNPGRQGVRIRDNR